MQTGVPSSGSPSPSGAETSSGAPALAVSNLVKEFSGVQALGGVSMNIAAGETVGLIGPNGSGKTTLINVVSGVLRPTSGTVSVAGERADGRPAHSVAALGVGRTFQQIRLFGTMTVRENIEVGALAKRRRGGALARVDSTLARLSLEPEADRPAGTLSYGTQRRAEIARALVGNPSLLLLDEPAAGMNEDESDELLATIRSIGTEGGCAVLIVDHDLRLMMRLCKRIHVLAEGRTIAEGDPATVQRDRAVIDAYLGASHKEVPSDQSTEPKEKDSQ
jgi:ABC-type branched-subunit amino acid transport system ATPase component